MTPSELVRALLEREAGVVGGEPSALELTKRWIGAVSAPAAVPGRDARSALERWEPDRRG